MIRARAAAAAVMAAAMLMAMPARAQVGQLRLTGTIDEEGSFSQITTGDTTRTTYTLGSRYAPNIDGYLLDPRLLVFSYSGSFVDQTTRGTEPKSALVSVEPYRLTVTALPYGLHSLSATASRATTDLDFDNGTTSTKRDAYGVAWTYRGSTVTPEATLGFAREVIEERFLSGADEERTRSTLALRLHKDFVDFHPTLDYSAETLTVSGSEPHSAFLDEGLTHRLRFEDRIRLGSRTQAAPLLEYSTGPEARDAAAALTVTSALSPSVDASSTVRYSLLERESAGGADRSHIAIQTVAAFGQVTKRFTEDFVLTTIGNSTYVTGGDGGAAWSGGGLVALRAAPLPHLRGVADYALQMSSTDTAVTVNHRGHLNATSDVLPLHTLIGDYFVTTTAVTSAGGEGDHQFDGQTLGLSVQSRLVPLTLLTASYDLDLQDDDVGSRHRQRARLEGQTGTGRLIVSGGGEVITEHETGGAGRRRDERALIADAGLQLRVASWLEARVAGRYGVRDIDRDERAGRFIVAGVTGSVAVTRGAFAGRAEVFLDRDDDAFVDRRGVRGGFAYRFRVWTITADAEFATQQSQDLRVVDQRAVLRISRPIDFTFP